MHLEYHETMAAIVKVAEGSVFLFFRAILFILLISATLCLIMNVVIPEAAKIIPMVSNMLGFLLMKIFGS